MTTASETLTPSETAAGRGKKPVLIAVGFAVGLLVVLLVAWAIDGAGARTARGLKLGDQAVGQLSGPRLDAALETIAASMKSTPIDLLGDAGTVQTTVGLLGLELDEDKTAASARKAGRSAPLPLRPFQWLTTLFSAPNSKLYFRLDRARLDAEMARVLDRIGRTPTEPSITAADGKLRTVAGVPGSRPDIEALAAELRAIDNPRRGPLTVKVGMVPRAPRFSEADANALVATLSEATAKPLRATLADKTRELDGAALLSLVRAGTKPGELTFDMDKNGVDELLREVFKGVGTSAKPAQLEISDGRVVVIEGSPGDQCCAVDSSERVRTALAEGRKSVDLSLIGVEPVRKADDLAALGIKELVGEFTTRHDCCAARVKNLHRMADLVQGMIIQPGDAFSLNEAVGRRTAANGFVAAPTINGDGNFEDDIGGGVSQFSTTLFNAAFFGGFDIPEYMAHGLYISRYPYGREATLSYPSPDLRIRNNTPYGVLIWPTYTDTSITVGLYSTRYATGEQIGQSEAQVGTVCVGVTTVRQRTWVTGETRNDRFFAEYAPAEGVQCDGSKRDKDGKTITTTTTTTSTTNPSATTSTTGGTKPTSSTTSTSSANSSSTTSSATTTTTSTSTTGG